MSPYLWPVRFIGQPVARLVAVGGDEQNRTVDPLLARQVLSQLSYAPISGLCLGESTLLSALCRFLKDLFNLSVKRGRIR